MKINSKKDIRLRKDGVLKNIIDNIKDKTVLDIGCVEHSILNKNKSRYWVHDFLRDYAEKVIGIDILEDDIRILKEKGYDVYVKNAENFSFPEKFDTIFAGEIIEHLSNPGLFIESCYEHLKDNGTLIITTPNCFSFYRLACILKKLSNNPDVNKEHTCWFSPTVIKELMRRYNFNVEKIKFVNYPFIKPNTYIQIVHMFSSLFKSFSETMIVFAKKSK